MQSLHWEFALYLTVGATKWDGGSEAAPQSRQHFEW